jgi:serine/threonine protein phosphatase PrpC
MRVSAWGATDPGRRRSRNEDSFGVIEQDGILVVADGMGGHRGGSVASKMAVEAVLEAFRGSAGDYDSALERMRNDRSRAGSTEPMWTIDGDAAQAKRGAVETEDTPAVADPDGAVGANFAYSAALALLRVAARQAGAAIYAVSRADPELTGMGTTLTAVVLDQDRVHVAHAGDSRCYLWRAGKLQQLTEDHSWIAEQLRVGAITEKEAKRSRFRHVITRSIGFERHADVEVRSVVVEHGDRLLLCSDGLFGLVSDAELGELLANGELGELPARLIALANDRGGDDNITAVVALLSSS